MKRLISSSGPRRGVAAAGLVLAGGRGSRFGGRDKGLIPHNGTPLALHALALLAPVSERLIISANRHHRRYAAWADAVVADDRVGGEPYPGPVAGIAACLRITRTRWLLTLPCDAQCVPAEVPQRLLRALRLHGRADAAVLRDSERVQPLIAAWRGDLGPAAASYLADGGRSAHGFLDALQVVEVRITSRIGNYNRPAAA